MTSTVSREDIAFRQWAGKHGIKNINPNAPADWPARPWDDLLSLRNDLNRALTATMQWEDMPPGTSDAVDMAGEMLASIKNEMDARDKRGDRSPRSSTGRLTTPFQPGYGPGEFPNGSGRRLQLGAQLGRDMAWAQAFPRDQVSAGALGFGEFLQAVAYGDAARIQAATATTYVGSEGGFLVPTVYLSDINQVALEGEIVRPLAQFIPMEGPEVVVPGVDAFDHTSNIGGFSGGWTAENTAGAAAQKPSLYSVALNASKLAIFCDASAEIVDDAANAENFLARRISEALSWFMDSACLTGDGVGKPLGVLNDPALIVQATEAGQGADSIMAFNILKMYSRLHPACVRRAVWVANPTLIPQLLSLHVLPTNIAGTELLPVGSPLVVQNGADWSMMGRPLYFSEKVPVLGDQGDLLLADFSQYYFGMRADVRMVRSEAPRWSEDIVSWKFTVRADGRGSWKSAVTPKYGSTQSWCVALAAR